MRATAGRATSTGRPAGGSSRARPAPQKGGAPSTGAADEQTDQPTTTPAGDSGPAGRRASPGPTRLRAIGSGGTAIDHGAAFILGLVLWVWVGLPFIRGGPTEVRNVLRAKFFNRDPKGNWLP